MPHVYPTVRGQAGVSAGVIVETLFLSSLTPTEVFSSTVLQAGRKYLITVQGTYSFFDAPLPVGSPQPDAMFPTPGGRTSTQVGNDAETVFATEAGLPAHPIGHLNVFQIDLGSGLTHLEPVGGPFSVPQPNFFYTYSVTGQGSVVGFHIVDTPYTDNYGKLLITIQTVGGNSGGGGGGSLLPDPSQQPNGAWLRTSNGTAVWSPTPQVAETDMTLSDVTTQNVSISKHGFAPKAPNDATKFLDGTGAYSAPAGAVTSFNGRTGAVVPGNADYLAVAVGGLTGATAATRYVGATTSNAPVSGTFAQGDFVVTQDGHVLVCTVAGSPGTWVDVSHGATSPLTTKGDVWGFSSADARIPIGSNNQVLTADSTQALGLKWATPGGAGAGTSVLIYRYTVSGSDKASIDTGVDAAQAGTGDWTNGDVLEIWLAVSTSDAGAAPGVSLTFNNDSGGNYDYQFTQANNTTVTASHGNAATSIALDGHGAGGSGTTYPAVNRISIPAYADTTFWKVGEAVKYTPDATAGNLFEEAMGIGYRSTSAITRLKVAPSSGLNLKIGTKLLIYKRTSS